MMPPRLNEPSHQNLVSDNISRLYKNLTAYGFKLGSYEDFCQKIGLQGGGSYALAGGAIGAIAGNKGGHVPWLCACIETDNHEVGIAAGG